MNNMKKKRIMVIIFAVFLIFSSPSVFSIVSTYDLRNYIDIPVKNQRDSNACWAFTMSTVFETNIALRRKEKIDISERHMDYATSQTFTNGTVNENGFAKEVKVGGTAEVALAYLTNGSGPVLEEEMPFSQVYNPIDISEITDKNVNYKVNKWVDFPNVYKITDTFFVNEISDNGMYMPSSIYTWQQVADIRNKIKEHIMSYGAVYAAINAENGFANHFNSSTYSYYCSDYTRPLDHAVVIIGWDDAYPKENFKEGNRPESDGAYIVQNSWGNDPRMNNGTFYISYEDALIESNIYGIVDIVNKDYDNIYQYDELGRNQYMEMLNGTEIYGANVFARDTNKKEVVSEVAIASYEDVECEIYINKYGNSFLESNLIKVGEGTIKSGYDTIRLYKPLMLKSDKFAVVVKYKKINNTVGVTTITKIDNGSGVNIYKDIVSAIGESYIGTNLDSMMDLYTNGSPNTNVCIKAFTNDYITGDVNNDGKVSALDLAIMQLHIVQINMIKDIDFADLNDDGRVSAVDLAKLQRVIVGLE